ncbi:MAG: hypothetical protein GF372_10055 [Candidatus Marinimicrobia bacterium]|nr:hypothetical protein [Candidatus Neomarinimicrobiota bacterium]
MVDISDRKFRPLSKNKLVIVEGKDDERFIKALIKFLDLREIEVRELGGKSNMRRALPSLIKESNFRQIHSLAIIRDADNDSNRTFQSIQTLLQNNGLPVPENPYSMTNETPNVMAIILPDHFSTGELEDLCLDSVNGDPVIGCIENLFDCVDEVTSIGPRNMSKAKVHAFLSTREDPTLRIGEAAEKGIWPFDNESYKRLREALLTL